MTQFRVCLLALFLLSSAAIAADPPAKRVVRVAAVITPESSGLLQQLGAEFEEADRIPPEAA